MISILLLDLFFKLIESIMVHLPEVHSLPDWYNPFISLLRTALYFFPADVFLVCVGNIMYCNIALIGWSIFEWAYKKIPGVS